LSALTGLLLVAKSLHSTIRPFGPSALRRAQDLQQAQDFQPFDFASAVAKAMADKSADGMADKQNLQQASAVACPPVVGWLRRDRQDK